MTFQKTQEAIKQEVAKMDGKHWYQSKTIWFNAITGAVALATTVEKSPFASDPKVQAGFALFVAIGNSVLRFLTDQPLNTPGSQ